MVKAKKKFHSRNSRCLHDRERGRGKISGKGSYILGRRDKCECWDLGEVGNYQIEISKGFLLNDLRYHLFFCFEELQFKELI
jgi:hypothetical protein